MKNFHLEVNKRCSLKEKTITKDFSSNLNQNICKKYSRDKKNLMKSEKNNLPKSTDKTNLKKTKEPSKNAIKSYQSKNELNNNKKNIQKNNRNILKRNNNNNKNIEINLENNNKKIETKNKSNTLKSPNMQNSCLENIINPKNKKKHVSRNNCINIKNPQLTDFINNKKSNKNLNKINNNNVLKSNLGLLITNNPKNFETDSILKENTSYFELNNLNNSNIKKNSINKSGLNEKEISSEDYLTHINKNNNKKIEKSSLLNSIININKYLTNEVSKSQNKINRDKSNKIKLKKTYENQLVKSPRIHEDINKINKNVNEASKSDFLQDNNIDNNNKNDLKNQCLNKDYYSSIINSNNHNKLLKKRKSFNLDDKIKINNKYIENILGFNTPRLTIKDEFIRTFRFSPKICSINHSIINEKSDYNNSLTKRIKVSKAKLIKIDDNNLTIKKESNKLRKDIEEISTKSKSNKNNNTITENKNLNEINEFKIINEFDLMKEENNEIKDNCNNIFDENFDNKDTQLNNYNSIRCENHEYQNNNRIKKRKNNYSRYSCIYSPKNIHNQYKTLATHQGNKYTNLDNDIEKNSGKYLKTLEEENTSRIQEIKIKLNYPKKRNKSKGYIYSHHSPSQTFFKHSQFSNNNNDINFYLDNDYSYEKTKINNQNIYTKQIFSNYNFKSKSKDKKNKQKINVNNINKLINLENYEYANKKCLYNNQDNNNNVFQQNNFYTTNNFFNCSSKRLDENKNLNSPRIYVKPSGKRNSQLNDYFIFSPKNITKKNEVNDEENKICKTINNYNKLQNRIKAYIKKSINKAHDNKDLSNKIKMKVINSNKRYKKYYNYLIKIKQSFKPICYITKEIKKPKYMPICKKNFITKIIYSIMHKPESDICFFSKSTIVFPKNNIFSKKLNKNNNKNIIKANILDFSLEQKKETITSNENNKKNHNRIIKYISNEKNYQESFGEINLSFSTEELNSFRQKESTIEGVFSEFVNMNSLLMNTEKEEKITFSPNQRNNTLGNFNNYESITFGRMINNISNYIETEKTERNERTSYKRDEIIREMKDNINLNLPIKLENLLTNESMRLNSERVHLNSSNNNKIKGMINSNDLINFTETLGSIFDKKMSGLNIIEFDNNDIRSKYMKFVPNDKNIEQINENSNNKKLYTKLNNNKIIKDNSEFNNNNELENLSYSNITFENINIDKRDIENEIRYLLNIITISNFNDIYENIIKVLKSDNHNNIKFFADNIINRFDNDKKYNILYSFLCKHFIKEFEYKEINEKVLCKILNISKKYDDINKLNTYDKYKFNICKENIFNKIKNIKTKIYYYFHSYDNINKKIVSMIKEDLINYNNNDKISFSKYTKFGIYELLSNYLEYCIDNVFDNKLLISNCNDFINKLISFYLSKNDNNNNFKNKELVDLFLNLDNIVVDNKTMFEIIGYLLYCLFDKKIYNINNFDSLFYKDEFTIINLAKIFKYTFRFCHEGGVNISNAFKETKLFKNKSYIFKQYSFN